MSVIREKLVKAIEAMPYDLDSEILNRNTETIVKEVIEKYVSMYGTEDLSESDKKCVNMIIGGIKYNAR